MLEDLANSDKYLTYWYGDATDSCGVPGANSATGATAVGIGTGRPGGMSTGVSNDESGSEKPSRGCTGSTILA